MMTDPPANPHRPNLVGLKLNFVQPHSQFGRGDAFAGMKAKLLFEWPKFLLPKGEVVSKETDEG